MKEYRLNIDPRILELLGPSLYTNIYYVLAELIANAYDADAQNVYILADKDCITVEDDGKGMSYNDGDVDNYLHVGRESRINDSEAITELLGRRKMGRKGVGKLAALSVSENVKILTIRNGERSGFILSRHPKSGNLLRGIPDEEVSLTMVRGNGSAVVMENPQYRLHVGMDVVQRNILRIFPLVSSDFKIHILRAGKSAIIEKSDVATATELATMITLGKEFEYLARQVPKQFSEKHEEFVKTRPAFSTPMLLRDKNDKEHEYNIEIKGWIGTYLTTKDRKAFATDFPDNYISIFANGKLGEFNILPAVGQNKLNEVYVVGQLHVDLFELTELPDMALSNRQGYKSDDPRYEKLRDYVRSQLLPEILRMRDRYVDSKNGKKGAKKLDAMRDSERAFKEEVRRFQKVVSEGGARRISKLVGNIPEHVIGDIQGVISDIIEAEKPGIGLKMKLDAQKRKILISQTIKDKQLSDVVYSMLCFNGIPPGDILYTNCDDEVSRIPEGEKVYKYLRDFFVQSASDQMIYVIFITSENTKSSWGALAEIGASWITQIDNKIFNIHPFRPEHPLDDESLWQSTDRDLSSGEISMSSLNADIFCQKIESVCRELGYPTKERLVNKRVLSELIAVI